MGHSDDDKLCRGPVVLTVPEGMVDQRVDLLKDNGFSKDDIARMVERHPLVRRARKACKALSSPLRLFATAAQASD